LKAFSVGLTCTDRTGQGRDGFSFFWSVWLRDNHQIPGHFLEGRLETCWGFSVGWRVGFDCIYLNIDTYFERKWFFVFFACLDTWSISLLRINLE